MTTTRRVHSGGRPSKGARKPLITRPPLEVATAAQAEAERLGLSVSDYLANVLAERLGYPPVASPAKSDQERLIA